MKIYPNPGSDSCTLEFLSIEQNAEFVLYNSTGELIKDEKLATQRFQLNQKQLDLTGLSNGIYFCGIQLATGERILDKLVVNN